MKLSDELKLIVPEKKQGSSDAIDQLKMADQLEATMKSLGVDVQPRFEISIAAKLNPGK